MTPANPARRRRTYSSAELHGVESASSMRGDTDWIPWAIGSTAYPPGQGAAIEEFRVL
jgi:hypothetical protein